jgi:hypothetical protein
MAIFLDPELREILRNQMKFDSGTNLAGQGGGGILGRLRNQAKQKTDPTYSSGFNYAQQIAGGVIPGSQVIAPGVSYSPEQAGGYTQKDLDMIAAGPAPVMPVAPTTGEVATIEDQMPYAPPGVQEPTRFMPFLQNLDFSGLPRYEDIRDIRGVEDIRPSLFDIDVQEILKDVDTLKNIDTEKFEDIDFSGINIPSVAPVMPTAPAIQQPITPAVQEPTIPVMPEVPVMPRVPVMPEIPVMPQAPIFKEPIPFVPEIPNIPMNFTALPKVPVIPNIPTMPQPIVPQPIPRASTPLIPSFVQPNIEEIVRPIAVGKQGLPQYGLFNLV